MSAGKWQQLAVTFDDSASPRLRFYVDGIERGSGDVTAPSVLPYDLLIGRRGWSSDPQYFTGKIDEVAIYNRALSAAEIFESYYSVVDSNDPPTLLASYPFEEGSGSTAVDATNNGRDGTITGASRTTAGKQGNALHFDSDQEYVEIPHPGYLREGSIMAWVRLDALPSHWFCAAITGAAFGGNRDGVNLGVHSSHSGNLAFGIYSMQWNWADSGIAPQTDTWYHLVGTWGEAGLRIYVNGELKGTHPYTGGLPSYTNYALIGSGSWSGTSTPGTIDEVRLYNYALAPEAVAAVYAASTDPDPVAHYPFSEGNGTTTVDASGNGYDGMLYNGVAWSAGKVGTGVHFDGVDDYIALDMFYDQVGHISEVTTCAWFKTGWNGTEYYDNWAFIDFDRSEYYTFYLCGDTGTLGFSTSTLQGTDDMRGNTVANDDQWHFGCAVYDGTDKILYLDGQEDGRMVNAHTGESLGTGILRYGFIGDGSEAEMLNGERNGVLYDGTLDEIRIYHQALSAEAIQSLYAQEPPIDRPFEVGQTLLLNTIDAGVSKTLSFQNSYVNPVVVAYIMTRNGSESIEVRVSNVSATGCTLFLEEPDNESHSPEIVGYVVMEAGTHILDDGTRVEAGTMTTTSVHREGDSFGGDSITFEQPFSAPPVVLHTLNTYQNGAFMSSVSPLVTSTGFDLQQEATGSGAPAVSETIGWIAIESGKTGILDGVWYETGRSQNGSNDGPDDSPHVISYTAGFLRTPVVLVDGYTGNGTDGYWARAAGTHSATTHSVYSEEDQVSDAERNHADEGFGFWAIDRPDIVDVPETSWVAAYPFAEGSGNTTADASGNGYDGNIVGASWTSDGPRGQALNFDGIDDYVRIDSGPAILGLSQITLEAWVKSTRSSGEVCARILEIGDDLDNSTGLVIDHYDANLMGSIRGWIHSGGVRRGAVHTPYPSEPGYYNYNDNAWHHVVFTYDGSATRLYVDGVLHASEPATGFIDSPSRALIGAHNIATPDSGFQGTLDEVNVYYIALSTAEVQALYNSYDSPALASSTMSSPLATSALAEPAYELTPAVPSTPTSDDLVSLDGQTLTINIADSPELNYGVGDFTIVVTISTEASDGDDALSASHVAVSVRDGKMLTLYLDGALQDKQTIEQQVVNRLTVNIGLDDPEARAVVEDVQLFDEALTPEEIAKQ